MEARPCKILEFFDGTKQMLVPLFQRPYEWEQKHWQTLWDDLLEQYERTEDDLVASHFTGAIVTAPARSVPVGVAKHLVIDGQQRLTTVAILLCAMRSLLSPELPRYRKLTRLLVNEDDEGLEHYKLLPTQPDRKAFLGLVAGEPVPGSRFTEAWDFFRSRLKGQDSEGAALDLDRVTDTLQSRITVVSIHLADADDPYLIFESLNAKGAPLTQADLIRNYLLLRLHSNEQQQAYEKSWLPMQELLGEHLTEFMRQFLMMTGEEVSKSAIYSVLKRRLLDKPPILIQQELQRMQQASKLYACIVGVRDHDDESIRGRLARLRKWEIATANPFVLKLMEAHMTGAVKAEAVAACLAIVESFVVRRAVCGVPTNQLKRIFLVVAKDMQVTDPAAWLTTALISGSSGRRWPRDDEFKDALFRYRAYAQNNDRCMLLLETIEQAYGHKEPAAFSKATIEHVLPQSLTDEWRTMLGANADEVHERWLDLLGNLTLTGYNSELSNSPFKVKRDLLAKSNFEMNKWIATRNQWTETEMRERTDLIFEKARAFWARPYD